MGRGDELEDDGRTIADMSGLEGQGLFGRRSSSLQGRKSGYQENSKEGGQESRPWEEAPFTWGERFRYMGMALAAALSVAFVLLAGIALVIWLFTLHA